MATGVVHLPNARERTPLPRRLEPGTPGPPGRRGQPGQRDDRHLRVVPPRRPAGLALRLSPRAGVVLTVLLFAALFAVAVTHALLIEGQAKVDELDQNVAAEQARYEELRREVAELESPQRILSEATDDLGMVPAGDPVWLTPDQSGRTGVVPEDPPEESPDTSAARVKPYMEPTG
jgi:cell division protein FtsL